MNFYTLFLFLSFSLILISSKEPEQENYFSTNPYSSLDELVTKYSEQISVSVVPLSSVKNSSPLISYYKNENRTYVSASMIKLLILCEFIEQIDSKTIYLTSIYNLRKEDIVGGEGIIQNMDIGTPLTYDQLALYMIKYSDNTATNVLIDILGMDCINSKAKDLNLNSTQLNRKMMQWNGTENYISAIDTEIMLKGILYKTIGSEEMCDKCIEYLLSNEDYDGVSEGLPKDVKYAHKTGSLDGIRHNGGIVFAEKPYIIIVLTKDFQSEAQANKLMKEISAKTYQIVQNGGKDDGDKDGGEYLNARNVFVFLGFAILGLLL